MRIQMRKWLLMAAVLASTATLSAQGVKPLPTLHVDGRWLVDSHGNHVVLHGVMDTPSMWFNGYQDSNGHHDQGPGVRSAVYGKFLHEMRV